MRLTCNPSIANRTNDVTATGGDSLERFVSDEDDDNDESGRSVTSSTARHGASN